MQQGKRLNVHHKHGNNLGRGGQGFKWKKIVLACIGIIYMLVDPVVQQAGQSYTEIEFRLFGCTMGWPVTHWNRVQAVWYTMG